MRSWMKAFLVVAFNCALALAAFGCASSAASDEYVGVWTFDSVVDAEGAQDEESTAFVSSLGVTEEITFNEDGTGTLHLFGESQDFTWERNGETQEVTMNLAGETIPLKMVDGKVWIEGEQEDGGVGFFVFSQDISGQNDASNDESASDEAVSGAESADGGSTDADDPDTSSSSGENMADSEQSASVAEANEQSNGEPA